MPKDYFKSTSKQRVIKRLENALNSINQLIEEEKIDKGDMFFIKRNIQISLLYLKDAKYK